MISIVINVVAIQRLTVSTTVVGSIPSWSKELFSFPYSGLKMETTKVQSYVVPLRHDDDIIVLKIVLLSEIFLKNWKFNRLFLRIPIDNNEIYCLFFFIKNKISSTLSSGRQRTLRSPLSAEFRRHCVLSGRTQRRA